MAVFAADLQRNLPWRLQSPTDPFERRAAPALVVQSDDILPLRRFSGCACSCAGAESPATARLTRRARAQGVARPLPRGCPLLHAPPPATPATEDPPLTGAPR